MSLTNSNRDGGVYLRIEKTPQNTGNNEGAFGEALTPADVIDLFQRYKGALQVFLGRRVHLVWRDGEIDWTVADKTLWKNPDKKNKPEKRMFAELRMIRKTINPMEEQIKNIIHQYAAIPLIKFVEESLEKLTLRDREIVFYAYINHDWESPIGRQRYRTLSNRRIAAIVGCDHKTVAHVRKRAIKRICEG
jgi:hypothetical protein